MNGERRQEPHEATANDDAVRVAEIETEIDQLAVQLWGLTAKELKEIKMALAELR